MLLRVPSVHAGLAVAGSSAGAGIAIDDAAAVAIDARPGRISD